MDYETIRLEIAEGGLAVLTFNRPPDKYNALNTQMRAEIAYAVKAAGGEAARALVMTGEGKAFCSGQDLGDRANAADVDLERTLRDEYQPILDAIYQSPIPIIAAVNGPAAGGAGANIALAADVVIAKESAYFMQAFAKIGLIPDAGGTYWMPRTMGFAKAMGSALFAEKITAQQASDWGGLIWELWRMKTSTPTGAPALTTLPRARHLPSAASARPSARRWTIRWRISWRWRPIHKANAATRATSRKGGSWRFWKNARRRSKGTDPTPPSTQKAPPLRWGGLFLLDMCTKKSRPRGGGFLFVMTERLSALPHPCSHAASRPCKAGAGDRSCAPDPTAVPSTAKSSPRCATARRSGG